MNDRGLLRRLLKTVQSVEEQSRAMAERFDGGHDADGAVVMHEIYEAASDQVDLIESLLEECETEYTYDG